MAQAAPNTYGNFTGTAGDWVATPGTRWKTTKSKDFGNVQVDKAALEDVKNWMWDMHAWSSMARDEILRLRADVAELQAKCK